MRKRTLIVCAAIAIAFGELIASGGPDIHNGNPIHHIPNSTGNGCDVSLSIPHPCTPDSNN